MCIYYIIINYFHVILTFICDFGMVKENPSFYN